MQQQIRKHTQKNEIDQTVDLAADWTDCPVLTGV